MLTSPLRGQIEAKVAATRPWLVVVDTLQKMAHRHESSGDRHDLHVGGLTAFLAGLALEYGCCVVTLSQVGRRAGTNMPTVESLRETGAIAEDADVLLLAWWPKLAACVKECGIPGHAMDNVLYQKGRRLRSDHRGLINDRIAAKGGGARNVRLLESRRAAREAALS